MQNISLRSSGIRRRQNFEIIFGFKSDPAVLTFTFCFLSSLLFSLSFPHFFFCWAFRRLRRAFWWERFYCKNALRILKLDERKGRWVVEQDFHGNFWVNVTWFFCLFLRWPWLNCADSGMVWKISSLSAHISGQSCPWPLKLMTSQVVEGTWICTGRWRVNGIKDGCKFLY